MAVTLGEILKYNKIKPLDMLKVLNEKYCLNLSQYTIYKCCNKEGYWFSKRTQVIQDCIKKEYGIYYDGAVWRGGINYGN